MNNYINENKLKKEMLTATNEAAGQPRDLSGYKAACAMEMANACTVDLPFEIREERKRREVDDQLINKLAIKYRHFTSNGHEVQTILAETSKYDKDMGWDYRELTNLFDQALQAYDGLSNNKYQQALAYELQALKSDLDQEMREEPDKLKAKIEVLKRIQENVDEISECERGLI